MLKVTPRDHEKVFCLGLPKTGLTSTLKLMQSFGYTARGRTQALSKMYYKRNFNLATAHYDKFDYHCDAPTPLLYQAIFNHYGAKSRYILTLRASDEVWYNSLLRHNAYAHPILHKHRRTFGRSYPHGFPREHRDFYNEHNRRIIDFFESQGSSDRLLTLRVDEDGAVEKLADFLSVDTDIKTFPRENVSGTRSPTISNRFKKNYNSIVQPLYGKVAPLLFPNPARRPFYPVSFETD